MRLPGNCSLRAIPTESPTMPPPMTAKSWDVIKDNPLWMWLKSAGRGEAGRLVCSEGTRVFSEPRDVAGRFATGGTSAGGEPLLPSFPRPGNPLSGILGGDRTFADEEGLGR